MRKWRRNRISSERWACLSQDNQVTYHPPAISVLDTFDKFTSHEVNKFSTHPSPQHNFLTTRSGISEAERETSTSGRYLDEAKRQGFRSKMQIARARIYNIRSFGVDMEEKHIARDIHLPGQGVYFVS